MTESLSRVVSCRLCAMPVAPDAAVCPSCGVGQPWIPDEPTLTPRVIRLLVFGGAIIVVGLLLFMSGVLIFGSPDRERDHRPPRAIVKGAGLTLTR